MIKPAREAFGRGHLDGVIQDLDDDACKPANINEFTDGAMRKIRMASQF